MSSPRSFRSFVSYAALLLSTGTMLSADTHRFVPTQFYNTLSAAHPPALRVNSGDRVITTTVDDAGADATGKTIAKGPYPQTGPFYIEGAEPGDLLLVTIEKLEPNRSTGASASSMESISVDPGGLSGRVDATRVPWTIDVANGVARFDLQAAGRNTQWRARFDAPSFELPLRPTLGFMSVAPSTEDALDTTAAGPFGGNLVSSAIAAGARVMLPVFRPGALLFLGHGQARRGDGGVTGAGIETSMDVQFTVEVVKKKAWPHSSVVRPSTIAGEFAIAWPRIETDDYVMTAGSASALLPALQHATLELHHWLDDDFGLSEKAVSILLGPGIEYEIAHVAESNFTVVAKVRKSYLPRPSAQP